jgi:hypothetical protein
MPRLFRKTKLRGISGAIPPATDPVPPIDPPELLRDHVSSETLLSTVPQILWYPNFSHLSTVLPGGKSILNIAKTAQNSSQFWTHDRLGAQPYPGTSYCYMAVAGWDGNGDAALTTTPYGTNAVRFGSSYDTPVSTMTNMGGPSSICDWIKTFCSSTAEALPGNASLGSTKLTEIWLRYVVMIEANVTTAIPWTQGGCKLAKILSAAAPPNGWDFMHWYAKPSHVTSARVKFYRYEYLWSATDFPTAGGRLNVQPDTWFTLGQSHCIETHLKCNSVTSVADGVHEIWVDDQLVHQNNAVRLWQSGNREINSFRPQIYHGGSNDAPTTQINHRISNIAMSSSQRIGAPLVP